MYHCKVLLLACAGCDGEWLLFAVDSSAIPPACPYCGHVPWHVSATWTRIALPWWDLLTGRQLPVESAWRFLWRLRWCETHEHPSGPIGARALTPGMQLIPTTAPNGDPTWSWSPTAGSEN